MYTRSRRAPDAIALTRYCARSTAADYKSVRHVAPSTAAGVTADQRAALERDELAELVALVGYYWKLGRIASAFQVELGVATGTGVSDAGFEMAAAQHG
jgi:hypothetical protein